LWVPRTKNVKYSAQKRVRKKHTKFRASSNKENEFILKKEATSAFTVLLNRVTWQLFFPAFPFFSFYYFFIGYRSSKPVLGRRTVKCPTFLHFISLICKKSKEKKNQETRKIVLFASKKHEKLILSAQRNSKYFILLYVCRNKKKIVFLICSFICGNKRKSFLDIFLCLQKSKLFRSWFCGLGNWTITGVDSIKAGGSSTRSVFRSHPISGVAAAQVFLILPPGQSIFAAGRLIMKKNAFGTQSQSPTNRFLILLILIFCVANQATYGVQQRDRRPI